MPADRVTRLQVTTEKGPLARRTRSKGPQANYFQLSYTDGSLEVQGGEELKVAVFSLTISNLRLNVSLDCVHPHCSDEHWRPGEQYHRLSGIFTDETGRTLTASEDPVSP
jgi:hypothetical protein